ncbi:MAG: MFS transporter [Dehalococcoidales bacterium]|nr:MAG: MFS transporter [Dehalococcoidales bacterium]
MVKKSDVRVFLSGLLPLFMLAHFGHHVIGASLRPLMPMIRTNLDLSYTTAGSVLSAFQVTSGISQLPAGWLADRFGVRLAVVIGISGVAVAGLMIGLSHSFVALIAFLVIAAILGGGYHPAASAAVSASVSPENRGRALGLHLIGGSSAFWIVPLIATPIAATWEWRSSFVVLSIPTIILGIALYTLISRRTKVQRTESQTSDNGLPALPTKIQWRKLAPFVIMSVATGTMVQSVSGYFSLFAVDYLNVAEATAGLLIAVTPLVGLFAAPMGGYLSDRFGSVPVLVTVSFLAAPLIFAIGVVPNVAIFIMVMVVIGLVTNARMPTSESYIFANTPAHRRSTILGFYFFAGAEAAGLLTPFVGYLIDRIGFYRSVSIISGSLAVIVVACSLFMWKNRGN